MKINMPLWVDHGSLLRIWSGPGFEKHLVGAKEALSRETGIIDAVEATHNVLKTQLKKSRVELSIARRY